MAKNASLSAFNITHKGMTLEDISNHSLYSYGYLQRCEKDGLLESARINDTFFDSEKVQKIVATVQSRKRQNRRQSRMLSIYDELLNAEQKRWIDEYIEHRKTKSIKFEGYKFGRFGKTDDASMHRIRNELSNIMYKIICGRAGIEGLHRPTERPEGYDPDVFKVTDLNADDMRTLQRGWSAGSYFNRTVGYLRPFLFYVLMQLRRRYDEFDEEQDRRFREIKRRILFTIEEIPEEAPRPDFKRKRLFFSRLQIITLFQKTLGLRAMRDEIRAATMLMIGFFLGIRTNELRHLRIEFFDLDENELIAQDEDGYGRLRIPDDEVSSKGGYSFSHPQYGTLVAPILVRFINEMYLEPLYSWAPQYAGKGYLFRPDPLRPDEQYTNRNSLTKWVSKHLRGQLDFLSPEDVENLTYYDTRHTLGELLSRTPVSRNLEMYRNRVAEIQMRHNIKRTAGHVRDVHYTQEVPENIYKAFIDEVLNYPWHLEGLELWEQELHKGIPHSKRENYYGDLFSQYQQKRNTELEAAKRTVHPEPIRQDPVELKEELSAAQKERKRLMSGPRGMTLTGVTEQLTAVEAKIKSLEETINNGV